MPLGRWFDKILSGGREPIVINWTETNPKHKCYTPEYKQIIHDDITLMVHAPKFDETETKFDFFVSNGSPKALGFGALGVGIVVSAGGQRASQPCKGLTASIGFEPEKLCKNVTVDASQEANIYATFGCLSKGEQTDVLIQANRIGAAPYLFTIPFGSDTQKTKPVQNGPAPIQARESTNVAAARRWKMTPMGRVELPDDWDEAEPEPKPKPKPKPKPSDTQKTKPVQNGFTPMQARECTECHLKFYTRFPDRTICDLCGRRKARESDL